VRKTEGKRQLRSPRCEWNIKLDLNQIGRGGMDWIDLAQDRDQWSSLVNTALNIQVSLNVGKFMRG
jgi:hypothetical protein